MFIWAESGLRGNKTSIRHVNVLMEISCLSKLVRPRRNEMKLSKLTGSTPPQDLWLNEILE